MVPPRALALSPAARGGCVEAAGHQGETGPPRPGREGVSEPQVPSRH